MTRHFHHLSHWVRHALLVLLALVLLAAPGLAYAQQEPNSLSIPSLNWYTMYGNNLTDRANTITTDSSGNIYFLGSTMGGWLNTGMQPLHPFTTAADTMNNNLVIAKFDSTGKLIWHTYYGDSRTHSNGRSILIDTTGNLYIIGESFAEWEGLPPAKRPFHGPDRSPGGAYNYDIVILKLNNAGVYQWHTYYGSDNVESGFKAVLEGSGNILIAGSTKGPWAGLTPKRPFSGETNFFALSVDPNGDYRWHTFYGVQTGRMAIEGMQVDTAGDVYLAGASDAAFTGIQPLRPKDPVQQYLPDVLVMKMSNAGVLQWYTFYGSYLEDYANEIVVQGSDLYLTGSSDEPWAGLDPLHPYNNNALNNLFVLKLNSAGAYQWHTYYGPANGTSLAIDNQGRLFVAGWAGHFANMNPVNPANGGDSLLMILDTQGKYQSHTYYGYKGATYDYDGASEIRIVGNKLYMIGTSGYTWPAFSFPPLHPAHDHDDSFLASISIVEQNISVTSTHLDFSANPAEIGRPVTLTAKVTSPGGVVNGGKVTFKHGLKTLGVVDVTNGQAKLQITPDVVGTKMITAQYMGTPAFLPSQTPGAIALEVVKAKTLVFMAAKYPSSPYGTEAIFSVFVSAAYPNAYQPTGWVVLKEGTRVVGSSLLTNGRAEIPTSSLSVGNVSLTAEYLGAIIFDTSTTSVLNYQVTKGSVSSTLAALPAETLPYGSDLTLKATVSNFGSAPVKPDGNVTFRVDDQLIGSATLANGTATVTLHTLLPGTHNATSTYTGSGRFNPANPVGRVISITQGMPRVTLTPEGSSAINSGETKRFTVTVQGAYPDLKTPAGSVKLYEGTTEIATLELVNGVATSGPLALSDGAHMITATYGGDALYLYETSRPAVVVVAGTPTYLPLMVR